jgi:hypothetical protein
MTSCLGARGPPVIGTIDVKGASNGAPRVCPGRARRENRCFVLFSQQFPSRYLKAADIAALGPPVRVTITNVEKESTQRGDKVLVIFFAELEKPMILKKTNGTVIAKLYGNDMDAWVGQQVDLVIREQDFKGEAFEVIRVQPPKGAKARVKVPDADGEPQQLSPLTR